MLISVVVPAYNEESYIGRCLDALTSQRHPDFDVEVIVVDNNSTDRTGEIARAYGTRLVFEGRCGVAAARQAGFAAARGEIIASTDADSAPPQDWLERLVAALRKHPETLGVYGLISLADGTPMMDFVQSRLVAPGMWLSGILGRPAFCGQNFAVRREAWWRVGGFDTDWVSAEDHNLSLKLARVGKVRFCPDIGVATSARRHHRGMLPLIGHTVANYARVTWLHLPPLPFENYR